jgi:hypothetical protein
LSGVWRVRSGLSKTVKELCPNSRVLEGFTSNYRWSGKRWGRILLSKVEKAHKRQKRKVNKMVSKK